MHGVLGIHRYLLYGVFSYSNVWMDLMCVTDCVGHAGSHWLLARSESSMKTFVSLKTNTKPLEFLKVVATYSRVRAPL